MTIGSIGLGLFILLITWLITLVIFIIGIKIQNNIAWIALGFATFFTVILLCIPTEKEPSQIAPKIEEKDYIIIYKDSILVFLILSTLVGFCIFFVAHCIETVRPKPLKRFHDN